MIWPSPLLSSLANACLIRLTRALLIGGCPQCHVYTARAHQAYPHVVQELVEVCDAMICNELQCAAVDMPMVPEWSSSNWSNTAL